MQSQTLQTLDMYDSFNKYDESSRKFSCDMKKTGIAVLKPKLISRVEI